MSSVAITARTIERLMRCSGTQFDCTESPLSGKFSNRRSTLSGVTVTGITLAMSTELTESVKKKIAKYTSSRPRYRIWVFFVLRIARVSGRRPGASGYKNSGKMDTIASKMGFPGKINAVYFETV